MFSNLLLSKPMGFLVGIAYVAQVALPESGGIAAGSPIMDFILQLGLPVGLVGYFLFRDDRREKVADKKKADERKKTEEKENKRDEEIKKREERMASRIEQLEDLINSTTMGAVSENNKLMAELTTEIRDFIGVLSTEGCPREKGRKD